MAYKEKSDAIKYNNQFNKEKYDRINLTVPKGEKEVIQAAAAEHGESVNAYIARAIKELMERENVKGHSGGGYGFDSSKLDDASK